MQIKVTVTGSSGCSIEHIATVQGQGDVAEAVRRAIEIFRRSCPDDSLFEATIRVSHA